MQNGQRHYRSIASLGEIKEGQVPANADHCYGYSIIDLLFSCVYPLVGQFLRPGNLHIILAVTPLKVLQN
jgi:hypothetical protein